MRATEAVTTTTSRVAAVDDLISVSVSVIVIAMTAVLIGVTVIIVVTFFVKQKHAILLASPCCIRSQEG